MSGSRLLALSLILLLAGLPFISWGSAQERTFLTWVGLLSILIGAALPPIARLAGWGKEDK